MIKFTCISILIMLSSCNVAKLQRIVEPLEAVTICGKSGIKDYSAMSGTVTCREDK